MSPIAVLNDCDDPLRCIGLPPTASAGNAHSSCASVDPVPIGDPDEDEGCDDDEDEDEDEDEEDDEEPLQCAGGGWSGLVQ